MPSERRYVNPRTGEVVDNPVIRPFKDVLIELGDGSTHSELSDAFWELLQRVQDTGKAGSITLTIKVAGDGHGLTVISRSVSFQACGKSGDNARFPF